MRQAGLEPNRRLAGRAEAAYDRAGFTVRGRARGMHDRVDQLYWTNSPVKREMNQAYRPELDAHLKAMHRGMAAGENLEPSAQIYKEAHWLVNYTGHVDAIERRLGDLRTSLAGGYRALTGPQDPDDGSFAPHFDSWIWRFFGSVEPLKELARRGEKPEMPLRIWDPVDTPGKIESLLRDLLISDSSSGHNKRKELNLAVTALGQLLWLDDTASVFPEHLDRTALAEALSRFVDEEWQDPETGYWGAWYRETGRIRKTNDLSITFHILSYRGGMVGRARQIAETTLAIRNLPYPHGWRGGADPNTHHSYNVARIINLTRHTLEQPTRAFADELLSSLKARALVTAIDRHGRIDPGPYTTIAEAYYFGVSFFLEVGLFSDPDSLGGWDGPSNPEDLVASIQGHLRTLDSSDPWVAAAQRKLDGVSWAGTDGP